MSYGGLSAHKMLLAGSKSGSDEGQRRLDAVLGDDTEVLVWARSASNATFSYITTPVQQQW